MKTIEWEKYGNGLVPMAVIEEKHNKFENEPCSNFIELVVSINGHYYHVSIRQDKEPHEERIANMIVTHGSRLVALLASNISKEAETLEEEGLVSWLLDTYNH